MINVNVSNNLQGVQGWEELAGMVETGETKATGDVNVRIENDQIVVTVKDKDSMQYVAVSVPDLGAMDEVPDTEALQSIAAKILDLVDTLAAVGTVDADGRVSAELRAATQRLQAALDPSLTNPPAPGGGTDDTDGASNPPDPSDPSDPTAGSMNTSKALFDLYALMAIMVQVAQKQRDASRDIRQTENLQIQNSIQQQADEMRAAAAITLGFGIASAVVGGVMSVVSLVQQARAFSQQTTATQKLEVPAQNLKAAELANSPKAAEANLAAVTKKIPEEVQTEINKDSEIGTAAKQQFEQKITAADKRLSEAKDIQSKAGKELLELKQKEAALELKGTEAAKAEVKEAEVAKGKAETPPQGADAEAAETKGTEVAQGKAEAESKGADAEAAKVEAEEPPKEADQVTSEEAAKLKDEIAAKMKEYDVASNEVAQAEQHRTLVEHEFFDKLDVRIRANDAAIEAKQTEIAANEAKLKNATGAEANQLKSDIKKLNEEVSGLKNENAYLRAYTAKMKADHASDGLKNADLMRAQNKYDTAKHEMELSNQYAGSQHMMSRWMGIQQLSSTLSQMTNAAGNMIGEMKRADGTMEGVKQTQHNEQLDQIKDLFQQAETVVQAVVQLMQAVLSAENDSLMEAIRA